MVIREGGDWVRYRRLPNLMEVDFHFNQYPGNDDYKGTCYYERMEENYQTAFAALKKAQAENYEWVLFTHGHSTSYGWSDTTTRSQIRKLIRSKDSTPYVLKSKSIQHPSVFVAKIRPK